MRKNLQQFMKLQILNSMLSSIRQITSEYIFLKKNFKMGLGEKYEKMKQMFNF
jgi:hypothetical protein